jgi:hypothetical protein
LAIAGIAENVFRQEGEYWTVAYAGLATRLHDSKGLHYIAQLLAYPGREFHVADIAMQRAEPDTVRAPEGDLGAVLDPRATAEYKRRIAELREELAEATAASDIGRAARVRQELDELTETLTAAYGVGGRGRRLGDPAERVRKAVTNQIRRTLEKVRAAHPDLGRHLTNALRTGMSCSYTPDRPVPWRV